MSCPTVIEIPRTECIGNSLQTINSNNSALAEAVCDNYNLILAILDRLSDLENRETMNIPEICTFQQIIPAGQTLGQTFNVNVWQYVNFNSTPAFNSQTSPFVTVNNGLADGASFVGVPNQTTFTFTRLGLYKTLITPCIQFNNPSSFYYLRLLGPGSAVKNIPNMQRGFDNSNAPTTEPNVQKREYLYITDLSSATWGLQAYFRKASLTYSPSKITGSSFTNQPLAAFEISFEYLGNYTT